MKRLLFTLLIVCGLLLSACTLSDIVAPAAEPTPAPVTEVTVAEWVEEQTFFIVMAYSWIDVPDPTGSGANKVLVWYVDMQHATPPECDVEARQEWVIANMSLLNYGFGKGAELVVVGFVYSEEAYIVASVGVRATDYVAWVTENPEPTVQQAVALLQPRYEEYGPYSVPFACPEGCSLLPGSRYYYPNDE